MVQDIIEAHIHVKVGVGIFALHYSKQDNMMERGEIYLTTIEKIVKEFLDRKRINYISQYPLRQGYIADFAILDKKIIIEVDGEHWHSGKKKQKKDMFRDYMLKRAGWKTIRIPEKDIDKLDSLLSSVI